MKSRPDFNLGHVELRTRSLGQILENPPVHSRGHNLIQSSGNLVRNFIYMTSWPCLKLGCVGSKARSLNLSKTLCTL